MRFATLGKLLGGIGRPGRVDPDLLRRSFRFGLSASEAFWVGLEGGFKHLSAVPQDLAGLPQVNGFGGEQAEAAVAVFGVVPGKKLATESSRLGERVEALREVRVVLQGLELGLRVEVVVAGVRTVVGFGHSQ